MADPAGTPPPPVFLHDSRITEVRCEKNAVTFCFADGFSLVENGQLTRAVRGFVTFSDCQPSDFFVWRVTGHPSRSGLQLRGKEIPLEALDRRFFARHGFIELFAEMYSPDRMHWRGVLYLPQKRLWPRTNSYIRHRDHGLLPDDVFLGRAVTFLCRIIDGKKAHGSDP